MAIRSPYDYPQRPDYIGGVGEALGGAAKTAESLSPAHPLIAKALRRVYAGEDPRTVAIETKFAMSRHQPPQNLPDDGMQMEPYPDMPPAEASGMRGSMRSSMGAPTGSPSPGNFTGPREFSSEETVMAPSAPPSRGSTPLPSEPSTGGEFYSQAQPPILNKDLSMLMQGAGLVQKDRKGDLGELNYLLSRDRLGWDRSKHGDMEVHRGIRDEATQANTAEIPTRRQQAERRLGISGYNAQTSRLGVDTRRGENYMKGAGNLTWAVPAMDQLLQRFRDDPELVPGESDYAMRRGAEIASTLQGSKYGVGGKTVGMLLERAADAALTPAQQDTRRQVRLIVQTMIVHPEFGATLTPQEIALANELTGEQLSPRSTAAGLAAFRQMTAAKWQRFINLYPDVAQKIGSPTGGSWGGPLPEPGEDLNYLNEEPSIRQGGR